MPFPGWAGRGSCCAVSKLCRALERLYPAGDKTAGLSRRPCLQGIREDLKTYIELSPL